MPGVAATFGPAIVLIILGGCNARRWWSSRPAPRWFAAWSVTILQNPVPVRLLLNRGARRGPARSERQRARTRTAAARAQRAVLIS